MKHHRWVKPIFGQQWSVEPWNRWRDYLRSLGSFAIVQRYYCIQCGAVRFSFRIFGKTHYKHYFRTWGDIDRETRRSNRSLEMIKLMGLFVVTLLAMAAPLLFARLDGFSLGVSIVNGMFWAAIYLTALMIHDMMK
jgi:hypothetical protein